MLTNSKFGKVVIVRYIVLSRGVRQIEALVASIFFDIIRVWKKGSNYWSIQLIYA